MKKYPLARRDRAAREVTADAREITDGDEIEIDPPFGGAFVSFRYACTEISSDGAKARMRSRRAAYDNGRLVSESFEGELDRKAYDRMIEEAQRRLAEQTSEFLGALFPFLRLPGKSR
jgi:hypothetical protein